MAKFQIIVTAWEDQVHEVEANSEAEALAQVKENYCGRRLRCLWFLDCGLDFGEPIKIDE